MGEESWYRLHESTEVVRGSRLAESEGRDLGTPQLRSTGDAEEMQLEEAGKNLRDKGRKALEGSFRRKGQMPESQNGFLYPW